jgi:hypothetical protein
VKLSEITAESMAKTDAQGLAGAHRRLHQLFAVHPDARLHSLHLLIAGEMGRRGLEHLSALKSLDGEGEAEPLYDDGLDLLAAAEGLPETIVWVPDFVSLSGSQVYARGREPNDADVVLRAEQGQDGRFELRLPVDAGLALKLRRTLEDVFGFSGVHYTGAPYGPNWDSLPLYSLCLVRNPDFQVRQVSDSEPEFAALEYKAADKAAGGNMEATSDGKATAQQEDNSLAVATSTKNLNEGDEHGQGQRQAKTGKQEEGQGQETLQEAVGEARGGSKAQGADGDTSGDEAVLADYPDESQRLRFVAQVHFRGASAHLDLRFEYKRGDANFLKGFTVAIQKPKAIKEPVTTLAEARKAAADPGLWKMDLRTGETKQREARGGATHKADLWAMPKGAQIPADWLDVEGVTDEAEPGEEAPVGGTKNYPGVFLIVQRGTCEWGAQKSHMAEFFLHGDGGWKGRWVFRQLGKGEKGIGGDLPVADEGFRIGFLQALQDLGAVGLEREAKTADVLPPGKASDDGDGAAMWLFIQADSQPYALSPGAIEKDWLPPKGVSCLPAKARKATPPNLRYWTMEGQAALDARKELAGIEELGGPELQGGKKAIADETLLADLLDMGWLEGVIV